MPRTLAPFALALLVAPAAFAQEADSGSARAHTEADVRFIRGMITHHAQAVRMAALVPSRTESRDIHLIAKRIDISQQDEIAWMQDWLSRRGEPTVAVNHSHPDSLRSDDAHAAAHSADAATDQAHAARRPTDAAPDRTPHDEHGASAETDHQRMPGMLSDEQMSRLAAARGAEFDRLFLEYMIQHHEGALTMVSTLLATPGAAQEPEIFRFASDVDADQRAEIARMLGILNE